MLFCGGLMVWFPAEFMSAWTPDATNSPLHVFKGRQRSRVPHHSSQSCLIHPRLCRMGVVVCAMTNLAVAMFVLDKSCFVRKITSKGNCCYSETRESALESVESRKWSSVSPSLTATSISHPNRAVSLPIDALSLPWVVCVLA